MLPAIGGPGDGSINNRNRGPWMRGSKCSERDSEVHEVELLGVEAETARLLACTGRRSGRESLPKRLSTEVVGVTRKEVKGLSIGVTKQWGQR